MPHFVSLTTRFQSCLSKTALSSSLKTGSSPAWHLWLWDCETRGLSPASPPCREASGYVFLNKLWYASKNTRQTPTLPTNRSFQLAGSPRASRKHWGRQRSPHEADSCGLL